MENISKETEPKYNLEKLAQHKLLTMTIEKQAMVRPIVNALKDYRAALGTKLLEPMAEKGALPAIGEFIAKQFKPVHYGTRLAERAGAVADDIKKIQTTINMGGHTPEQLAELTTKLKNLGLEHKELLYKSQSYGDGFGAYKRLWGELRRPGHTWDTRAQVMKDLMNMTGHYGLEGLNTSLMWGMPAFGAYNVYQAPEGEKAQALGQSLGETAGFLFGGPLGAIPGIVGSVGGNYLGGHLGKSIGDVVSPPSLYRRVVRDFIPRETKLKAEQYAPAMLKGVSQLATGRSPTFVGAFDSPNMLPPTTNPHMVQQIPTNYPANPL